MILLGEVLFFSSWGVLGYAVTYWLWLTAFVVLKEEADLRRVFGTQFDAYCREVPRLDSASVRAGRATGGTSGVGLRDAGVADQHVSQTTVCDTCSAARRNSPPAMLATS